MHSSLTCGLVNICLMFFVLPSGAAQRTWEDAGSNIECDGGAGEVYMKQSPGKNSDLAACKKSCEEASECQSITYFKSGFCSHFSSGCTKTKPNNKAMSMRLKGAQQTTTQPSTTSAAKGEATAPPGPIQGMVKMYLTKSLSKSELYVPAPRVAPVVCCRGNQMTGQCTATPLTYSAATAYCKGKGMRLCSANEIGKGRWCDKIANAIRVWTTDTIPYTRLVRSGVQCSSGDIRLHQSRKLFNNLAECADACDKSDGCQFFLYGSVGKRAGQCWHEQTTSRFCPKGFESSDEFDFYMLTAGTDSISVGPSPSSDWRTVNVTRPGLTCPLKVRKAGIEFMLTVEGRRITVKRINGNGRGWTTTLTFDCTFEYGRPFFGCYGPAAIANLGFAAQGKAMSLSDCDALAVQAGTPYFALNPTPDASYSASCLLLSGEPDWKPMEPAECNPRRNYDGKRLGNPNQRLAVYEASPRPSWFGSNVRSYPQYQGDHSCTGTVASWFSEGALHLRGTLGGLEPGATMSSSANSLGVHVHTGAKATKITGTQAIAITLLVQGDPSPTLSVTAGSFPGSWQPFVEGARRFSDRSFGFRNISRTLMAEMATPRVFFRGLSTPGVFAVTVTTTGVVRVLAGVETQLRAVAGLSMTGGPPGRLLPVMRADPKVEPGFYLWTPGHTLVCAGGHYYNTGANADPWTRVSYGSPDATGAVTFEASMSAYKLGYALNTLVGRPIVVHDRDGRRACCTFVRDAVLANIGRYPGYNGPLAVSGTATVTFGKDELVMAGTVTGLQPQATATAKADSMGVHIRSGTSCAASQLKYHYFDQPPVGSAFDPWLGVRYNTPDTRGVASFSVTVGAKELGFPIKSVIGRAVVVHDAQGQVIGCGVLRQGDPPSSALPSAFSTAPPPPPTTTANTTTEEEEEKDKSAAPAREVPLSVLVMGCMVMCVMVW